MEKTYHFHFEAAPNHVEELRKGHGFSRAKLANLSKLSEPEICSIERYVMSDNLKRKIAITGRIKNTTAEQLANAFQVKPGELFEKYEEAKKTAQVYFRFSDKAEKEAAIESAKSALQEYICKHGKRYFPLLSADELKKIGNRNLYIVAERTASEGLPQNEFENFPAYILKRFYQTAAGEARRVKKEVQQESGSLPPTCSQREYLELKEELEKVKRLITAFGIK